MSGLVKYVSSVYKAKSLGEVLKRGVAWALLDGNVAESTLMVSKGATLVGTDYNGNKYYTNPNKQFGRHRWVVYGNQYDLDAQTVPAEWHSWLHSISDALPGRDDLPAPKFALPAVGPTPTGTKNAYKPKGDWWQAQPRNWRKVEAWQPPGSRGVHGSCFRA